MHVSGFNETTEHEVADALDQFGDLKGLILDLRQNPGGLLSEGVGVADKFLQEGTADRFAPRPRFTGEALHRARTATAARIIRWSCW